MSESSTIFNVKSIALNNVQCTEIITEKSKIDVDSAKKQLITGSVMLDTLNSSLTHYIFNDYWPEADANITTTSSSGTISGILKIDCKKCDYFLCSKTRLSTTPIYFKYSTISFENYNNNIIYISESFAIGSTNITLTNSDSSSSIPIGNIKTSNKKIKLTTSGKDVIISKST